MPYAAPKVKYLNPIDMDFKAYKKRIGWNGHITPDFPSLRALQRAHLYAVPFENLDIHQGREIVLEPERLFDKIVSQHRGGFCYELNGLFYFFLKAHGFEVKRIAAQVNDPDKGIGKPFDHLALVVRINGADLLVDVGFGEFTLNPLRILMRREQRDERGVFLMEPYPGDRIAVKKQEGEQWRVEYVFDLQARAFEEYQPMCHYHQTSPDSHFTQNPFCSLTTPDGRITLTGNRMKIRKRGKEKEFPLEGPQGKTEALWNHFGIRL